MRAAARVAIGSALLAAIVGVWALSGRPRADEQESADPASSAPATLAAAPRRLTGPRRSPEVPEGSPVRRPSRWLLRGRIVGLDAREVAGADLTVSGLPVTRTADGTFEVDVTALLSAVPRPEDLVAAAEHPDFLRTAVAVPVPGKGETDPAILECVLPMRRARAVWVRVVDEARNPIADAPVGAFPMRGDVPDAWPCEEAQTDLTGSARIRLPAEGPTLVLATSEGRLPASVIVDGAAAQEPTLRLSRGSGFAGGVHEDGRPVAGAVLMAYADSSSRQQMHLGETEVHWDSEDGVAPARVQATTDAEGRYRMEGLPGWPYRVCVERLADGRRPFGYVRMERPPAGDVDFDLALGHVVFAATSGRSPVPGARICIFAGRSADIVETDARGEAQADLRAQEAYSAQVDCDGYRQARVEFEAPAVGARRVVAISLQAVPPHGVLTVVLRDPQGKPIPIAGLAFFSAEGGGGELPSERFGDERGGRFRVDDVEAGRYRLAVRPGRHWNPDFTWESEQATWLDATTTVEVPRQGEGEVVLTARPGGRLRIDARDAEGRFLTPTCALRDASGEAVPFVIATRFGSGGAYRLGGQSLDARAPGDVVGALPPGRYRLNLTGEGLVDASVELDVKAGATETVRVTMERAAGNR